jgi:hypothetical protein
MGLGQHPLEATDEEGLDGGEMTRMFVDGPLRRPGAALQEGWVHLPHERTDDRWSASQGTNDGVDRFVPHTLLRICGDLARRLTIWR